MASEDGSSARPAGRVRPRTSVERRAERAEVDDPDIVLAAAARLLEARARSVAEVRRRLVGAGYQRVLVEGVVARLVELGMLDDEAFARAWVASRDRARPRGERALRDELRVKGIAPELIAQVLAERAEQRAPDDDGPGSGRTGELGAADRLLARNERSLRRIDNPRKRRQRAWALLARAGFDADSAREAVGSAERRWSAGEGLDRWEEADGHRRE
jgi:regulatory protein